MKKLALGLALFLFGCPAMQSPAARAQEAASDMNLNARFNRMELAAEAIAPKARESFFEHRKGWGGKIRLADYELTGVKMAGDDDADVYVKVAWYRADEGDLRMTTLKQKWHDFHGDWKLTDEKMQEGDVGLLGEPPPIPVNATPGPPKRAQFPTIRLGQNPPDDEQ